ncbi:MAG: hypothetical protein AAF800_02445 [Planctomycetota bacterium]
MSTATLSKKERKALRKQMLERKEALLAKHGRGGTGGAARSFADVKPKLPGDPPKPAASARAGRRVGWSPPAPPRTLPPARPRFAGRTRPAAAPETPPIRRLDEPGPLTRSAAAVERGFATATRLWRDRPWKRDPDRPARRAQAHRGLATVVRPLRFLGLAAVGGAVALGRASRAAGFDDAASFVVLGLGLGLAVGLLALAEIAAALATLVRGR